MTRSGATGNGAHEPPLRLLAVLKMRVQRKILDRQLPGGEELECPSVLALEKGTQQLEALASDSLVRPRHRPTNHPRGHVRDLASQ